MIIDTIRVFGVNGELYRLGMDFETDTVLFQCLNPDAETPDDEWHTILRYDSSCRVWDVAGKLVGEFQYNTGGNWVFRPSDKSEHIQCKPTSEVEGLIDSEVMISKYWLTKQN